MLNRYAHVINGVVIRIITDENPGIHFGPAIMNNLYKCPDEVDLNWQFDGVTWEEPTAEQLDKAKDIEERQMFKAALPELIEDLLDKLDAAGVVSKDLLPEVAQKRINRKRGV